MSSADKLIDLFNEAKEKAAGLERERFLAEACGNDSLLKQQILSLLQAEADEGDSDFLKRTPLIRSAALVTEKPGDRIGRYKLLQQIGEGGCGVVYMAEQEEPVRRRVALKVIKLGMDTKSVITRFEADRQALALMDHPNIARVLDAGSTETGRPYFVMELVRGIKLTEFCDEHKLSTAERLKLFIPVCHAIQHAHQKGVIHRDIKPSNILVTINDGAPVPKVIDFGIAKATQGRLTDQTMFTAFEQFIGTPAYMSPEQAVMTSLDIDTRSDIYSLGVLLYELLTGRTPFDQRELLAAGLDEMRRTIREKEPPKPSTRLSALMHAELTTTADRRHTEAPKLIYLIRGDLDWVVMRALEKDRSRRYETANGLAADVRHYLNNEPVTARPPSNLYRLQKLVHRNRLAFAAAAALVIALLAGLIILISSNLRITHERNQKDLALKEKAAALNTAQASEKRAKEQLFLALKNQAQARRLSRQMGQRLDSLAAVTEASRIRKDAGVRDEAIAAMALPDIRHGPKWSVAPTNCVALACDSAYRRYALLDLQNGLTVRNIADDHAVQRLNAGDLSSSPILVFSPDGRFLAMMPEGQTYQVWLLETGESILQGRSAQGLITPPAFSSDSRLVAFPEGDSVRCFDLATGTEQNRWKTAGRIHSMQFHPRGRRLAVGYEEQAHVSVYDTMTGRELVQLPIGSNIHASVCWHPEGNRLAVGTLDPRIQIWDVEGRRKLATLEGHAQEVTTLTFHPGGMLLASGSWDGVVGLWDLATGRQEMQVPLPAMLRFSNDGERLGFFWADGEHLQLLEVTPAREYFALESTLSRDNEGCYCCSPSPDNRLVAGATDEGTSLWDLATRREIALLPTEETVAVAFEPDGLGLLTCSPQTGLMRWPIRRPTTNGFDLMIGPAQKIDVPFAPQRLAWSRRFATLAIVSETAGQAAVLNPLSESAPKETAKAWKSFLPPVEHAGAAFVALSPDAQWLATSGWHSARVRLWNAHNSQLVWEQVPGGQTRVSFTPDGRELIIGRSGDFSFLDVQTFEIKRRFPREVGLFAGEVVFSPDGKLMALELAPGVIHLKEATTARTVAQLQAPLADRSGWMTFSSDGTKLITITPSRSAVHVWDLRAIRSGLKKMGLDWDWPEFPPSDQPGESEFSSARTNLRIQVVEAVNP